MRSDPDVGADLGSVVDRRRRMPERTAWAHGFECGQQPCQRDPRRIDGQDRFRIRRVRIDERGIGQHGRRARAERDAQVAFVDGEGQRRRVGVVDRGDALDRNARVADDPAAGARGKFRQRPERRAHGVGDAFSTICKIFSISGVMSTPP